MEAAPGIEPGVAVLQTDALPLGYAAINNHQPKVARIGRLTDMAINHTSF
jgi:hypothetical protein